MGGWVVNGWCNESTRARHTILLILRNTHPRAAHPHTCCVRALLRGQTAVESVLGEHDDALICSVEFLKTTNSGAAHPISQPVSMYRPDARSPCKFCMMRSHTVVFPLAVPPATPMIKGSVLWLSRLRVRYGEPCSGVGWPSDDPRGEKPPSPSSSGHEKAVFGLRASAMSGRGR